MAPPGEEEIDWPERAAGPVDDYGKILFQAQVNDAISRQQSPSRSDVEKATTAAEVARQVAERAAESDQLKALWANEYALRQSAQQAYLDMAKGAVDRSQQRAQFVQVAAGAIGTLYAAGFALLPKAGASPSSSTVVVPAQITLPGQAPVPVQVSLPAQVGTTAAAQ